LLERVPRCVWVPVFSFPFFRIGRTGRAGKTGIAVSFFVAEKNARLARELIDILNRTAQIVPPELQAMASFSSKPAGRGGFGGRRY
jgi:ATP-dependent RNA helicase DDX5/DBP2